MLNGFSSINIYLLSADSLGKITLNRETAIFPNFNLPYIEIEVCEYLIVFMVVRKSPETDSTYVIYQMEDLALQC